MKYHLKGIATSVALAVAALFTLTGCNGTISSVSFPAEAPWDTFATSFLSPYDDLFGINFGDGVDSEGGPVEVWLKCGGGVDGEFIATCSYPLTCDPAAECAAQAPTGHSNPQFNELRYLYFMAIALERSVFTAGGVEVVSAEGGGTAFGMSLELGSAGLEVAAAYSTGLIDDAVEFDDVGSLFMYPAWSEYGPGELCGAGGCAAICEKNVEGTDYLGYVTFAPPGVYSGICGNVPVTVTINPTYSSIGDCISDGLAACSGLTGQDRKACNSAKIGICQATFNVSSAHTG